MRCPNCKNHVLQKSGRQTKLRTKGPLLFENGVCRAQCFWCKSWIQVPLSIQEGTSIQDEQFFIPR